MVAGIRLILFLILFFLAAAPAGLAGELAVIANLARGEDSLTLFQVRAIFRGEMSRWSDGKRIVAVNQRIGSPSRVDFYRKVLEVSPTHKFYPGQGPVVFRTIQQDSSREVKRLVASVPDAVGYVEAGEEDKTVKVLFRTGLGR